MAYESKIVDPIEEFKSLALIYVKAQNLTGRTPGQILDLYNSALEQIYIHHKILTERN